MTDQQAREAYDKGDIELSKQVHQEQLAQQKQNHKETHVTAGEFLKSAVYGGLDGIITAFAIVMGVSGANFDQSIVLALGISNILSDGAGMGLGDFLASQTETDFINSEKRRELWEVENNPEGEKKEMFELYTKQGMEVNDAKRVCDILANNQKAWVEIMMVEELELLPGDENPAINGIVTTLAFWIFGIIPLLPYIVNTASGDHSNKENLPYISIALTGVFLFVLGWLKSIFIEVKWYISGIETLFIGAVAAAVAYLLGYGISQGFQNS